MLGLPILAHDIGSLGSFGDEIGNEFLYSHNTLSLSEAMGRMVTHLRVRRRPYDVTAYDAERCRASLRDIMNL